MAAKKRRERTARERKRAGAATRPLSGNDGWMDGWVGGGITESSKERGGTAGVRGTGAICSTRGPPQGGATAGLSQGLLFYSLAVVPSATRAEVEKSTAPFTTSHHFLEPSVLYTLF